VDIWDVNNTKSDHVSYNYLESKNTGIRTYKGTVKIMEHLHTSHPYKINELKTIFCTN